MQILSLACVARTNGNFKLMVRAAGGMFVAFIDFTNLNAYYDKVNREKMWGCLSSRWVSVGDLFSL